MHTTKMVVTVAIAPLFLAAIANAQLTFAEVETQHWSDPLNWSPVGPPSASDLAIIPIGETCKVINPNATAHNLEVYGTLGIVSRQLTIVKNVTVDGTIYL